MISAENGYDRNHVAHVKEVQIQTAKLGSQGN